MIDWNTVAQIVTITGTAMYYGGRFLTRLEIVEKSITKIERRIDELAGGTTGPITIVAAAAGTDTPKRGGTQAKPQKAKAS